MMRDTYRPPTLAEAFPALELIARTHPALVNRLAQVQEEAREFGRRHIDPIALEVDARVAQEPDYFPWDVVQRGMERGYLTFNVPVMSGGRGETSLATAILQEELCAHCAGIGNIIGAHGLGLAPLLVGGYDMHKYYLFVRDTVRGEREGRPILWAFAITEPSGGSDVEDADEVNHIPEITRAQRCDGGYRLNGRKVFISNGSVARYISVYAALDARNPRETMVALVVPNDAPGFSVVRVEHKMGQRACPAAELVFDDVFVPDTSRLGAEGSGMPQLEAVLSASRGPVGAIATGIAQGAFERAWNFAVSKILGDHRLIDEQWVQMALAEMQTEIHAARQAYFLAALIVDLHNPFLARSIAGRIDLNRLLERLVHATIDLGLTQALTTRPSVNATVAEIFSERDTPANRRSRTMRSALASAAKVLGSDVAMSVTARALEIVGEEGSCREVGLEKFFRDAKLTQIYEGTNQINRLNIFKRTRQ